MVDDTEIDSQADSSEIICEIGKNRLQTVVFSIGRYKGKDNFGIRIYYLDKMGKPSPTKSGVTLTLDKFTDFKEAVQKLEKALHEKGLIK